MSLCLKNAHYLELWVWRENYASRTRDAEYMPANTSMQGTYIPQYTQVPPANISVEESAVQQPVAIETRTEHTSYSYQHDK